MAGGWVVGAGITRGTLVLTTVVVVVVNAPSEVEVESPTVFLEGDPTKAPMMTRTSKMAIIPDNACSHTGVPRNRCHGLGGGGGVNGAITAVGWLGGGALSGGYHYRRTPATTPALATDPTFFRLSEF